MCYYTFEMENSLQQQCAIRVPLGKFVYNHLPVGLCCAPDICQEVMKILFRGLKESDVFLDKISGFSEVLMSHTLVFETY